MARKTYRASTGPSRSRCSGLSCCTWSSRRTYFTRLRGSWGVVRSVGWRSLSIRLYRRRSTGRRNMVAAGACEAPTPAGDPGPWPPRSVAPVHPSVATWYRSDRTPRIGRSVSSTRARDATPGRRRPGRPWVPADIRAPVAWEHQSTDRVATGSWWARSRSGATFSAILDESMRRHELHGFAGVTRTARAGAAGGGRAWVLRESAHVVFRPGLWRDVW